uniref:hypothetical protein n=1 Tax=uncultured Caulobacter sp. TaxID=158749 RepID=UPI0025FDA8AC|nr:hypothetical protein [uncultured Caulobacter sp.]
MAIGYSSFVTPTANVTPIFNGGRYAGSFSNTATFTCGSGETCAAGAYRQYVMGSFTANGSPLRHVLCGAIVLSTSVYYEDGCPPNGASCAGCTAYGYRACTMTHDRYTNPNQATGADFWMTDAPGFNNVRAGTSYAIDLFFQGKLINATNNSVLVTQTWTVNGSATAGGALAAAASDSTSSSTTLKEVGLSSDDQIISADLAYNLITGSAELQVLIRRPVDSAPLSADALQVATPDADENAIPLVGVPEVYEIGNRAGVTTTLVYGLADGAALPELVSLTARPNERLRNATPHVTVLPVKRR